MASNIVYQRPSDLPDIIPVFPLEQVILLPRGQLPLNVFEQRYMLMVDDALKNGTRIIGIIQPRDGEENKVKPRLADTGCIGRITQLAETGDGRYLITLHGIARFALVEEMTATTLYRRCRVTTEPFLSDFTSGFGADAVNRPALLASLARFLERNDLEADWDDISQAPNEELVNALAMMSPWGIREKQALLDAQTLKERADLLVTLAEMSNSDDDKPDRRKLQ